MSNAQQVHHRIKSLARAVLQLMSVEGLTDSEYRTANQIWELAALLENGREDRRRAVRPRMDFPELS